MELIPAIREKMAQLDAERGSAKASGYRAALWRSQQHAARLDHTVEDLKRYCVESLMPRQFLEEDDYLRGYREGFQAVLDEVRRVEQNFRGA